MTRIKFVYYNAVRSENEAKENEIFYCVGRAYTGLTLTIGTTVERIPNFLFNPDNKALDEFSLNSFANENFKIH